MTRAEWDALSAREKDAVVAENVMGWKLLRGDRRYGSPHSNVKGGLAGIPTTLIHPYTTSWEALRQVVEKLTATPGPNGDHHCIEMELNGVDAWVAVDRMEDWQVRVTAPTAPEAVAVAALTALGHMEAA